MIINTKGLVIKEQTIKESDKLITILTERGIIRAFVSNAKRLKSKNLSSTGLMCYSEFTIYKSKDKYIINDSNIIEPFFNLRKDITKLSLVQYFCELAAAVSRGEESTKELLKLVLNAIYILLKCSESTDIIKIKAIVEIRLMCISGFMPDLICCKNCNKYEDEHVFFVLNKGILYCSECYDESINKSKVVVLNQSSLLAFRHIVYSDFNKIFNFNLKGESLSMLSKVAESYVLDTLDISFGTLEFYKSIIL